MRRFIPSTSQRSEQRKTRKQLRTGNYHDITPTEEKEILEQIKGKISFKSLTLRGIDHNTVATTFIVRTHKPIRWIDFIRLVSQSLEEVL